MGGILFKMARTSFKSKNIWKGSNYSRGGLLHDKHGNTYRIPVSYRNNHSGLVLNSKLKLKGVERNRHHNYAYDPTPIRLTKAQTRQKKAIMASLRRKGKIR